MYASRLAPLLLVSAALANPTEITAKSIEDRLNLLGPPARVLNLDYDATHGIRLAKVEFKDLETDEILQFTPLKTRYNAERKVIEIPPPRHLRDVKSIPDSLAATIYQALKPDLYGLSDREITEYRERRVDEPDFVAYRERERTEEEKWRVVFLKNIVNHAYSRLLRQTSFDMEITRGIVDKHVVALTDKQKKTMDLYQNGIQELHEFRVKFERFEADAKKYSARIQSSSLAELQDMRRALLKHHEGLSAYKGLNRKTWNIWQEVLFAFEGNALTMLTIDIHDAVRKRYRSEFQFKVLDSIMGRIDNPYEVDERLSHNDGFMGTLISPMANLDFTRFQPSFDDLSFVERISRLSKPLYEVIVNRARTVLALREAAKESKKWNPLRMDAVAAFYRNRLLNTPEGEKRILPWQFRLKGNRPWRK